MKLNAQAMQKIGQFLDAYSVPAEDRMLLCWIEGTQYRVDSAGCWHFVDDGPETGWSKCPPPMPLRDLFGDSSRLQAA